MKERSKKVEMYNYHTRHKVFISFYHEDDQEYKDYIDRYLSNQIINKSVKKDEYSSENSDEYIKRLIREDKVSDSSVIVVLVGPNTRKRKHVDWEIYAGLRNSINGASGLIGILLPTFPLNANLTYNIDDIPLRLADNVRSGYAQIYTWNDAIHNFNHIINIAFNKRMINRFRVDNTRLQMKHNLW